MSTKDPRKAKQYATRKDAVADAKAIGWQVNDVNPVEVMGFKLYAITDPHMNLLTAAEVEALKKARDEKFIAEAKEAAIRYVAKSPPTDALKPLRED